MLLGSRMILCIRSELPVRILEGLRAHSGGLAGVHVRRSVGCLRASGGWMDTANFEWDAGVIGV